MAFAVPSQEFMQRLQTRSPAEQLSIGSGFMPDLGRYGLPLEDVALLTLAQRYTLPGPSAIRVDVFIWPERITTGLARARTFWFGIVRIDAASAVAPGRLLVAKAWDVDPGTWLVTAEQEIIAIAAREFP